MSEKVSEKRVKFRVRRVNGIHTSGLQKEDNKGLPCSKYTSNYISRITNKMFYLCKITDDVYFDKIMSSKIFSKIEKEYIIYNVDIIFEIERMPIDLFQENAIEFRLA